MIEKIVSNTLEDTRNFGILLASHLKPGDVIFLSGDLGAGKSELTRGIALGLGIQSPIPSPTFTILNVYEEGKIPLYHFDWYRIEDEEELFEIGTEEYLYGNGLTVVEWPSKAKNYTQNIPHLMVTITTSKDYQRYIRLEAKNNFREFDTQGLYHEYTQL